MAGGTWLTGAVLNVGLLDGLLGVAGMICLIVSQWIIPENSLRTSHKYPLVILQFAMEAMARRNVDDFPSYKPPLIYGMFHGEMLVITSW